MSKFRIFSRNFLAAFGKRHISDYAASAAFFLFLSLIPILMLLFALLPYTGITESEMLDIIRELTPDAMDSFVTGIINEVYIRSAGIITVSIVITLWSAGKSMQTLIRCLNAMNDIEENRGYFVLRALGCLYTVIMLVAVFIMLVLLMFGRTVISFITYRFPGLENIKPWIIYVRYPVSLVLLILLFTAIYCVIPSKKQKFRLQIPGAVFSAVVWSFASYFFSKYLDDFNGFSTYGSLTTVIVIMMYMYMMMYIILTGAYLNQWLGRSTG